MTTGGAYGLEWAGREIAGNWQGIAALRFAETGIGGAVRLEIDLMLAPEGLTPADIDLRDPDGERLLATVSFASENTVHAVFVGRGPRGASSVRLLSGGRHPLHPFYAAAAFDFYIDCPAGDCRESPDPAPLRAPASAPAIDLTTKDYDGFVRVAEDWALATDPNWSGLSPASVERTLIELLAHHAEMLSLYQDRVAQEGFIDTARERGSLRRHASFLGLTLDEGASASVLVAVDLGKDVRGYLPAGTRFIRRDGHGGVAETFVARERTLLDARWNAGLAGDDANPLKPAAWPGAHDAVLPEGATALLLWGEGRDLRPGRRIALMQGSEAHAATLTAVTQVTEPGWAETPDDELKRTPNVLTLIEWDAPTRQAFRPWKDPPFLVTANLVEAIHGDPRRATSRKDDSDGTVPLDFGRRNAIVAKNLDEAGKWQLRALRTPEAGILPDADGRPGIALTIDGEAWEQRGSLWNSAGFDRHFTTEREEDGSVWLLFGDGRRGAAVRVLDPVRPKVPIEIEYRRGAAAAGNVGAFALHDAAPPVSADKVQLRRFEELRHRAVANPLPASGGRAPVSSAVARQLIPESLRNPGLERCVTLEDYRRAAETTPGVARAVARDLGGMFNTVVVLCAPETSDALPASLRGDVHARLDALRMAGREHVVRGPDYAPLDVALVVHPARGADAAAIRREIRAVLSSATPGGFFHRSRIGFGVEARLADVLATVHRAPGVDAVRATRFRRLHDRNGEETSSLIRFGPTELPQFAADDARPDHGRLAIRIEGMDDTSVGTHLFEEGASS